MLGPCKQKHHLPSNPTSTVNQPLIIQINAMKSLSEIKVKSPIEPFQFSTTQEKGNTSFELFKAIVVAHQRDLTIRDPNLNFF